MSQRAQGKRTLIQLGIMGFLVALMVGSLFMPAFVGSLAFDETQIQATPRPTPSFTNDEEHDDTFLDFDNEDFGLGNEDSLGMGQVSADVDENPIGESAVDAADVDTSGEYASGEDPADENTVLTPFENDPYGELLVLFDTQQPLLFYLHAAETFSSDEDAVLHEARGPLVALLLLFALLYIILISGFLYLVIGGRYAIIGRLAMVISAIVLAIVHFLLFVGIASRVDGLFPLANLLSVLTAIGLLVMCFIVRVPRRRFPRATAAFIAIPLFVPTLPAVGSVMAWNATVNNGIRAPEGPGPDIGNWIPPEDEAQNLIPVSENRDGVFTFVIVGTDWGDPLTDTILVATFDTNENTLNVLSVPRDTQIARPNGSLRKINEAYLIGLGNDHNVHNGFMQLRMDLQRTIGIAPQYYFVVSLNAFKQLIDAFGGVYFDVPQNMRWTDSSQDLFINLQRGYQHLDGYHALHLVRFRSYQTGDKRRMEVTQEFLAALFEQATEDINLNTITSSIVIAEQNTYTNLRQNELFWFAERIARLDGNDINFHMMPGDYFAWYRHVSYVIVDAANRQELIDIVNTYMNPTDVEVTAADLDLSTRKDDTNPWYSRNR